MAGDEGGYMKANLFYFKRHIVNPDTDGHYSTQAVLVIMKLILSQAWLYMTHSIMVKECALVMLSSGLGASRSRLVGLLVCLSK